MQPRTMRPRASRSAPRAPARAWLVAVLPLCAVVAADTGAAGLAQTAQAIRVAEEHRQPLSMDHAVELAEHHYHARVVRAAAAEVGGRRIDVLKLLSEQGRVWTVHVDAETGAMN